MTNNFEKFVKYNLFQKLLKIKKIKCRGKKEIEKIESDRNKDDFL